MYIELDFIVMPFAVVFFICWFAFSLLIIFKPHSWIDFQNKLSKHYGYQWIITDEKKFSTIHKRAGILLLVFGIIFVIIFIAGLIRIQ